MRLQRGRAGRFMLHGSSTPTSSTIIAPYRTRDGSGDTFMAIKNVPILPSGSPVLHRELTPMKGMRHRYVLGMDALYSRIRCGSGWSSWRGVSLTSWVGRGWFGGAVAFRRDDNFRKALTSTSSWCQEPWKTSEPVSSDGLTGYHLGHIC
jgi:hypothetical protein